MARDDVVAKHASPSERRAFGKSMRDIVTRESHAHWHLAHARPEAIERVAQSLEGRIEHLKGLRNERMSQSPFAFYRGAAALMAIDLLHVPPTKLFVQLCGDAHVRNLGTFARFDGSIGFDVNDFDEALRGPFEWDLKRLVASIVLAGREAKHGDAACEDAVRTCVATYRERMKELSELSPIEVARRRAEHQEHAPVIDSLVAQAKHKTHSALLEDLTEGEGAARKFKPDPPIVMRVADEDLAKFAAAIEQYRTTLSPAMQQTYLGFRLLDVAFKVAGVGSVGLAAYVALLTTGDNQHSMILQLKEARESTVEGARRAANLPTPQWAHQGQRIVEGQRAMQSIYDPYVGFCTLDTKQFMVRRLAENKASIDDESVHGSGLAAYAKAAGAVFAYSHAVTGDPVKVAAYVGNSTALDDALAKFAHAYADQTDDDFASFAARFGRSG